MEHLEERDNELDPDLSGFDLRSVCLEGINLRRASLSKCNLRKRNLKNADLREANLHSARLQNTNLTGVDLSEAKLTDVKFHGAIFHDTILHRLTYRDEHDRYLDGTDIIIIPSRRYRLLNWSNLRGIGAFPLFGVSWISLATSLIIINGIGFLNEKEFIEAFDYPVPIPERAFWILISSILLAIGSTTYRISCPARVQEFSEIQWIKKSNQRR